jgi:plastocyanin
MKTFFVLFAFAFSLQPVKEKMVVHTIGIEGMRFVPGEITIKKGDKVQWINSSGSWHNVVANDKSFASEMLEGNGSVFSHCFTTPGTYPYFCRPHRLMGMKGKIIVTD